MPIVVDPALYHDGARSLRSGDLRTLGAYVNVSAVGLSTGSSYYNDGADYGPDTPGTTTSGIAEALASAYAVVQLTDSGVYTIASTLNIPASKALVGPSFGGLGYSDVSVLPTTYLNYTGASGDAITVYGTGTVGASLRGIAITGNTTGSLVHFGGGQRGCALVDVYLNNSSTATNAYALRVDTALANYNSEDSHFVRVTAYGGYAGIGIGYGDQTQKPNNCDWYSVTTGGGTYGVVHVEGGHHTWVNWYDRSNPSAACYYLQAGNADFYGGELQNATNSANLILVTNGVLQLNSCSITGSGTNQTTLNIQGGTVKIADGCQFNTAQTISLTGGGKLLFDRLVVNAGSNATITGSGATLYLPTVATSGAPTHSGFSGTVTTY